MKKYLFIFILICISLIFLVTKKTHAQDATSSSDTIREKVQEKVTQVLNSPKAYIGTITDISSTTIQIRKYSPDASQKNGEIEQISTDQDTVFVSVGKTTKTIKFVDVAIGDFIVAMGYKNGNNVLDAKRLLVTEAMQAVTRTSIYGKVTKLAKSSVELTTASGENIIVEPDSDAAISQTQDGKETKIRFSEIEMDNTVIAMGTGGETFSARKIVVILAPKPTPTSSTESSPEANPETSPAPTSTP